MNKKIITFGVIEIKKLKLHRHKNLFFGSM